MNLDALINDEKEAPEVSAELESFETETPEEAATAQAIETEKPKEPEEDLFPIEKSEEAEPEIDLLAEISQPTDKDQKKAAAAALNPDAPQAPSRETTIPGAGPAALTNHNLTARLTVAALNIGLGMMLQAISQDWSDEAEKKFTLSESRKKDLIEPLEMMFQQQGKKYNPVVILVITVVVTYMPMFGKALKMRKDKAKERRAKLQAAPMEVIHTAAPGEVQAAAPQQPAAPLEVMYSAREIAERVKKIRSKRGARTKEERKFMESLGL